MSTPTQFGPPTSLWAWLNTLRTANIGIFTFSGVPVDGASGTYAGFVGTGGVITNTATGVWYTNVGTLAVPSYRASSIPVAGSGGLGVMGNAKMTYSFATDGGATGTITPSNSPTIPIGAIILGGTIDITTSLTSGGAALIGLGLGNGAQALSLISATAVASWTSGQLALIPVFTAATYVKVTAETALTLRVSVAALTAGRFDVNLVYVQGNV